MNINKKRILTGLLTGVASLASLGLFGQGDSVRANVTIKASPNLSKIIRLRWAPTNPKAWTDGIRYGYTLERYTLIKDSVYQPHPERIALKQALKPAPLPQWEKPAEESDYAAVIAQAIYGKDFELASPSNGTIGQIINRSVELEQRFATSLFMAEYDYKAAELAGWAYSDSTTNDKDQYLYRVILDRPQKQPGDTAFVFTGFKDRQEFLKPLDLDALWGDKGVVLLWNYELLSRTYHSYHVERKSEKENAFRRITRLPVTAMDENKRMIFYTDSFPDNETIFSYRVIGINSFGEEGIPSDTITGKGRKALTCIPNIYAGQFVAKDKARIYYSFECEEIGSIEKLIVKRSSGPDGEYETVKDNIPPGSKETELEIKTETNYLKLYAVSKDSVETSSFPFSLNQIDSIPPSVPLGLKVSIDTAAIAHLSWTANTEPDLRGYRILRSFTPDGEKSSITSDFLSDNQYTDTLSLEFGNEKVYYALTALDMRYNESKACETVEAAKPNLITPAAPRFTAYELKPDGKVFLSWMTDRTNPNVDYLLLRTSSNAQRDTVFIGNEKIQNFTDQPDESGDYEYIVIARNKINQLTTSSPQPISISLNLIKPANAVANFRASVNTKSGTIELSWKTHPNAVSYSIYKKAGEQPIVFWKEVENTVTRLTDEVVSPDTDYEYTIVYTSQSGGTSQAKTTKVHYY